MQNIFIIINNFFSKFFNIIKKYFLSILAVIILVGGFFVYLNISNKSNSPQENKDNSSFEKSLMSISDSNRVETNLQNYNKDDYEKYVMVNEILNQKEIFQADIDYINYNVSKGEAVPRALSDNFLLKFDNTDFKSSEQNFIFEHNIKRDYSIMKDSSGSFNKTDLQDKIISKSLIVPDDILKSSQTEKLNLNKTDNFVSSEFQTSKNETFQKTISNNPEKTIQKPKKVSNPKVKKPVNKPAVKTSTVKNSPVSRTKEVKTIPKTKTNDIGSSENNKEKISPIVPDNLNNLTKEDTIIEQNIRTIYDLRRNNKTDDFSLIKIIE
jgi:hypothetical protein